MELGHKDLLLLALSVLLVNVVTIQVNACIVHNATFVGNNIVKVAVTLVRNSGQKVVTHQDGVSQVENVRDPTR